MKKVVVVGGGTGTFTVLSGLKKYPLELSAVVAMSDNGGSTGILRDELGVLPPGDVRQCLVALSRSDQLMRTLMNYRFSNGTLKGHSFGNLLLSALERITGSFDLAVEKASEILLLEGKVLPATLDKIHLIAHLANGKTVRGEAKIEKTNLLSLKHLSLKPSPKANPKAITALTNANLIIFAPGDLYTSIIPTLLVPGIPQAITQSKAKKVYVCNLMNKLGHTDGFSVEDHVLKLEEYLGGEIHNVIVNNQKPSPLLLKKYAREGEHFVEFKKSASSPRNYITHALIRKKVFASVPGDAIRRTFIRHDPERLARLIFKRFILPKLY